MSKGEYSPAVSVNSRLDGNRSFRMFQETSDVKREKAHLESALRSYTKAFETAETMEDKSSASKNFAIAACHMALVCDKLNDSVATLDYYFRESVCYFSKATIAGMQCKDEQWQKELADRFNLCVDSAIQSIRKLAYRHRVVALEKYAQAMCEESQMARIYLEMADVVYHYGTAALDKKDFLSALQAYHDCYRPIQECMRLTRCTNAPKDIAEEIRIIEKDVLFHMASAEAMQAVSMGDGTLKEALEDDEILSMDKVYDSMDLYKKAVIAAREIEVEMEAIAVSRLGVVYDKVLKMKSRANDYFRHCFQLSQSLAPRNLSKEPWYITCLDALKRYQQESALNDDVAKMAERAFYMKELVNELKDLNQANVGGSVAGFLKHIYKTYPPKNSSHTLDEQKLVDDTKACKKILLTAIQHYHPDKQDVEAHGKKWAVLCEEITKLLNGRYQTMKFPSD